MCNGAQKGEMSVILVLGMGWKEEAKEEQLKTKIKRLKKNLQEE